MEQHFLRKIPYSGVVRVSPALMCRLVVCLVLLSFERAYGGVICIKDYTDIPGYGSYAGTPLNRFIVTTVVTNSTEPSSDCLYGHMLSATSNGTNCYALAIETPLIRIETISIFIPADQFAGTYTAVYTNATNIETITIPPQFILHPASRSAFVGDQASLSAFAIHTSGWHWQKDGTNLVEDGHFSGVTSGELIITNLQATDAGAYSVVADQPGGRYSVSLPAKLSVFKALKLILTSERTRNGYSLRVSNLDGTQFEPERISKLGLYRATSVNPDLSGWQTATNAFTLVNEAVQTSLSEDGAEGQANPVQFWRVLERP